MTEERKEGTKLSVFRPVKAPTFKPGDLVKLRSLSPVVFSYISLNGNNGRRLYFNVDPCSFVCTALTTFVFDTPPHSCYVLTLVSSSPSVAQLCWIMISDLEEL